MFDLRHGDCLDPATGLASLPDFSVDVTLTDPPYEAEVHTEGRRIRAGSFAAEGSGQREIITKAIEYDPITEQLRREVARQIARVTRRWILVYCQVEAAHLWRAALEAGGAEYVRTGSWHKTDAQPQYSGDRPGQGWEAVVICHGRRAAGGAAADLPLLAGLDADRQHAGALQWNGGGRVATWGRLQDLRRLLVDGKAKDARALLDQILAGEEDAWVGSSRGTGGDLKVKKLVDGQKPEWLIGRQVELFSDPGELVLDPFAGSGTTGVCAVRSARRFIGWEKHAGRHAAALKRIGEAV